MKALDHVVVGGLLGPVGAAALVFVGWYAWWCVMLLRSWARGDD